LALVIGPAALISLALYWQYMAPITIVALIAGTVLLSRNLHKSSNCCKISGGQI
jgi:hypothetical protein